MDRPENSGDSARLKTTSLRSILYDNHPWTESKMKSNWHRTAKQLGAINSLLYFINQLFQRTSKNVRLSKYYIFAQPVPKGHLIEESRGAQIEVRRISRGDPVLNLFSRPTTEIEDRFDSRGVAFAAFKSTRLVGFIWLIMGPYREPDDRCVYSIDPDAHAAWDLDIFVDPGERLSFTFVRLWDAANDYLRMRGIEWTLSRISAFNPDSISSHSRLKSQKIGQMTFLTAGSWQITLGNIAPYVHISTNEQSMPEVKLCAPKRRIIDE